MFLNGTKVYICLYLYRSVLACTGYLQLDLDVSLEEQGPFCVLLHKLTDIIALANQGDTRVSTNTYLPSTSKSEYYLIF